MKALKDRLTGLFKTGDKKIVLYLGMLVAVGVLMMLLGGLPVFSSGAKRESEDPPAPAPVAENAAYSTDATEGFDRERELEKRLEEIFALVEDVGRVRVMLSLTPTKETVYAADTNISESVTKEQDAQGGIRETETASKQDKTILVTDRSGVDRPLVLREIEPGIAGVIIIAEGGDSVFVKDALTKAACTVLGIEANKVWILKMQDNLKGE